MKAIHLDIKNTSDDQFIIDKQIAFSYAKKHIYGRVREGNDNELERCAKENFDLNDIEARSLISAVKTRFEMTKTDKEGAEERIVDVQSQIKKLEEKKKITKLEKRDLYKLKRKLRQLEKSLPKDITFGGKHLLKEISHLNNQIRKEKDADITTKLKQNLIEKKMLYQKQRINSVFLLGEANQKGNRFFNFDLTNQTIYYKPKKGIKIKIEFSDKRRRELEKIQQLIDKKEISVCVYLSSEAISLVYDDAVLNGYCINKEERKKDVEKVQQEHASNSKEVQTDLIKGVYKEHYEKLDELKFVGKLKNRYLSIDSNPNFIGCAIIDKKGIDDYSVVDVFYYNLTKLNENPPKDASSERRKSLTRERNHEICNIWKDIFNTMYYYRCANIVCENLDIDKEELKDKPTEANRQIYNVWHRELSSWLIDKYCNQIGIKRININAAYSTTIGNLMYNYIDCINAAIEIGRRGIFGFTKEKFYPPFCKTYIYAMSKMNPKICPRDVKLLQDCKDWKEVHNVIQSSELRYRKSVKDLWLIGEKKKFFRSKSTKLIHGKVKKIMFIN